MEILICTDVGIVAAPVVLLVALYVQDQAMQLNRLTNALVSVLGLKGKASFKLSLILTS